MKSYNITFQISDGIKKSLGETFELKISLEARDEQEARAKAMDTAKTFHDTVLPGVIGISECVEILDNPLPGMTCMSVKIP